MEGMVKDLLKDLMENVMELEPKDYRAFILEKIKNPALVGGILDFKERYNWINLFRI